MKHDQFAKLPSIQQCLLIKNLAVAVAFRRDSSYRYYLYQLDSFYIEIKVGLYIEQIEGIVSFSEPCNLNSYLEGIDISNLLH